jgi:hypothetical protein
MGGGSGYTFSFPFSIVLYDVMWCEKIWAMKLQGISLSRECQLPKEDAAL